MVFQIKKQPTMIRPEEGAGLFMVSVLLMLGMGLLSGGIGYATNFSGLVTAIFGLVMHLMLIGFYLLIVTKRRKFLRYPLKHSNVDNLPKKKFVLKTAIMVAIAALIAALIYTTFHMPHVWTSRGFYALMQSSGGDSVLVSPTMFLSAYYNVPQVSPVLIAITVLTGISSILVGPISEGLIFRGALLSGLSRQTHPYKAVLLSALSFSIFHMNAMQTVYPFFLGVVAGFAVIFSGKLFVGIAIHASSNIIAFSIQTREHYSYNFNTNIANVRNFLSNGLGIFLAIGILLVGSAAIFGLLVFYKKTASKLPTPPPLDELMYSPTTMAKIKYQQQKISVNPFERHDLIDIDSDLVTNEEDLKHINLHTGEPLDPFAQPMTTNLVNQSMEEREQSIDEFRQHLYTLQGAVPPPTQEELDAQAMLDMFEPQSDEKLTQDTAKARKKATWRFYWLSNIVCIGMWAIILISNIV